MNVISKYLKRRRLLKRMKELSEREAWIKYCTETNGIVSKGSKVKCSNCQFVIAITTRDLFTGDAITADCLKGTTKNYKAGDSLACPKCKGRTHFEKKNDERVVEILPSILALCLN